MIINIIIYNFNLNQGKTVDNTTYTTFSRYHASLHVNERTPLQHTIKVSGRLLLLYIVIMPLRDTLAQWHNSIH